MAITSVKFLIFLCIVFAAFYICPVKYRWTVLLVSSIYFYIVAGAAIFVPFTVYTSLIAWLCARGIGQLYEKQDEELKAKDLDRKAKKQIKESYKNKARKYLLLALFLCIGMLCVTKFTKYVIHYMNLISDALGNGQPFSAAWIIVPLGISYYTFTTVGYVLDVYWKRYAYENNFFRFYLYAIYFPHVVQGPISRYNLLGQELKKELRFDSQRVVFGMELMLWGFFKKLVIADRLNVFVRNAYNGSHHAGSMMLVAMFFDGIQIYTDFSGYTDIVRGVSQIFGVELEQNFNHPFFSQTVPEYWRRWHMTMGGWFKDYVYYPTTISKFMKNINKKARNSLNPRVAKFISIVIPISITWVLTGLWHGTGKTYLCWGIYYAILLTISNAFQPEFQKANQLLHINTEAYSWKLFRMCRTFCCFLGGRLLTSPGALWKTKRVLYDIIFNLKPGNFFTGNLTNFGLSAKELVLVMICIVILWAVDCMQERFSVREALAKQNIVFRWIIIFVGIFSILIFGVYGIGFDASAFLYTQY